MERQDRAGSGLISIEALRMSILQNEMERIELERKSSEAKQKKPPLR